MSEESLLPIIYRPFPTLEELHQEWDKYLVRAVKGPYGSGKSVGVVQELLYIGMRQEPVNKIRYTRIGVIRATYNALRTTTRDTLLTWLPAGLGYINSSTPMMGTYVVPLRDGTSCNIEFYLLAIDDEKSMEKLRSTNFTYIWLNEATELQEEILSIALARCGRFPSGPYGKCTNHGLLMDYNNPPDGHWIRAVFDSNTLSNYKEYVQPPACFKLRTDVNGADDEKNPRYKLNKNADNLSNLPSNYYRSQIEALYKAGKFDVIDLLYCLELTKPKAGKPVWEMFDKSVHVLKEPCAPDLTKSVMIGSDTSGLHPCSVIAQNIGGDWIVQKELFGDDTAFDDYVNAALVPLLREFYPGCKIYLIGDPSNPRNSLTGTTAIDTLKTAGIHAEPASTNDVETRIDTVATLFNRRRGGLYINPDCTNLIEACHNGYHYKKISITGTETKVYSKTPNKNMYSHYADALQYLALGIIPSGVSQTREDVSAIKAKLSHRLNVLGRRMQ